MLELLVGLLFTAGLAPFVRAYMLKSGFLDIPNHRSSHIIPTPRAGGIACLGGLAAAVAVAVLADHRVAWPVLIGAVVLSLVGLADDRNDLPAVWRLGCQAVTGALVGLALGGPWAAVAGMLLFLPLVNATNFMDGINGISSLTMVVWGISAIVVGGNVEAEWLQVIGGVTAGLALGFLPFNAPGARLFLGDVGSYLFGALVAGGTLLAWSLDLPVAPLAAPLAIYAVDTGAALLRRAARGESLTQAHREHVYQTLTGPLGFPHLGVAAYAAALAGAATVACHVLPWWGAGAATAALSTVYLASPGLVVRLERTGSANERLRPGSRGYAHG